MQALSSVEHGYDLLAPKFDHTPFRTPESVLDATVGALRELGPFSTGLDVCCGTGAGMLVLRPLCGRLSTGVDFSAGGLIVPAGGPDRVSGALGRYLIQVEYDDLCALRREHPGDGLADAGPGAGDDGDISGQLEHGVKDHTLTVKSGQNQRESA